MFVLIYSDKQNVTNFVTLTSNISTITKNSETF